MRNRQKGNKNMSGWQKHSVAIGPERCSIVRKYSEDSSLHIARESMAISTKFTVLEMHEYSERRRAFTETITWWLPVRFDGTKT